MEKQELIELTNKLYKLTLLFPKKEPIRYRMREIANRVLESFISKDDSLIKINLEIIDSYFEIVKWQNWVSYFDVLSIKDQYDKMKDGLIIEKPINLGRATSPQKKEIGSLSRQMADSRQGADLNKRQETILEILKEKKNVQVWEVNKILVDVSKRTLRRDFEYLLEKGFVVRMGEKNETFYKLA